MNLLSWLISPPGVATVAFILVVVVTILGALIAVSARNIFHNVLGLVLALIGVAGLFLFLNSPFVAMMQILIYVGAITILIAFAVMLAGPMYRRPKEWTTPKKLFAALAVVLFSLIVPAGIMTGAFRSAAGARPLTVATEELGRVFLDKLTLPFELISLLIVVSIIGAIMLALFSKEKK